MISNHICDGPIFFKGSIGSLRVTDAILDNMYVTSNIIWNQLPCEQCYEW